MFKNLIPFRVHLPVRDASLLERHAFVPTAPTQRVSIGWVPPRGEHQALVENIGGHILTRAAIETRDVPGPTVAKRASEMAKVIEDQTGRKPGRKAMKELRDEALFELLPHAFPKRTDILVWINGDTLCISTPSAKRAEDVVTLLVKTFDGATVVNLQTNTTPAGFMAAAVTDDGTGNLGMFWPGRDVELRSCDEMRSVVRYKRKAIGDTDAAAMVQRGMTVERMELSHSGRNTDFILTNSLTLRGIKIADVEFESGRGTDTEKADAFDADAAISTGVLSEVLKDLIEVLGGELKC